MLTKLELDPIPKARKSVKDVMDIETPLVAMANDIRSSMLLGVPSGLVIGASARPDSKMNTSSNPIPRSGNNKIIHTRCLLRYFETYIYIGFSG